jgi:hypothetical protein
MAYEKGQVYIFGFGIYRRDSNHQWFTQTIKALNHAHQFTSKHFKIFSKFKFIPIGRVEPYLHQIKLVCCKFKMFMIFTTCKRIE